MTINQPILRDLHETIVSVAREAALAAGAVARKGFIEASPENLQTEQKAGFFDIVTACDKAAEAAACDIIWSRLPQSRILGEESGWQGEGETTWIIDPIDGTSNFASGLPFFCVSIAAYHAGEPVCGIVYDPMREELFMANAGRLTLNGDIVSPFSRASSDRHVELLSNAPYEGERPDLAALEAYADLVTSFRAVRRLGSCALHLAYVAVGRVAIAYESKFSAWDIAAGLQLVAAASGQIIAQGANGQRIEPSEQALGAVKRLVVAQAGFDYQSSCLSKLMADGKL
ncbi:inositol monophosphatase [Ensifer adhaerens]|uniref:inositol monophosphatase family protein n=1 Tax=Ensifer canadensis TaxID=555315 RepID=UPI0014906234|nr:inositol monophosphatase [Ensifer canadensis]NOV17541.1 inositol monophosphatase [Ensifer canadensis]